MLPASLSRMARRERCTSQAQAWPADIFAGPSLRLSVLRNTERPGCTVPETAPYAWRMVNSLIWAAPTIRSRCAAFALNPGRLNSACAAILKKKGIGSKDDFFDLGGTSLALIRIFSRVNNHFNVSLNGSILVDEATVSRLANCVDAQLQDHHQAQSQVLGRT